MTSDYMPFFSCPRRIKRIDVFHDKRENEHLYRALPVCKSKHSAPALTGCIRGRGYRGRSCVCRSHLQWESAYLRPSCVTTATAHPSSASLTKLCLIALIEHSLINRPPRVRLNSIIDHMGVFLHIRNAWVLAESLSHDLSREGGLA